MAVPKKLKKLASDALRMAQWDTDSLETEELILAAKEALAEFGDEACKVPREDLTDFYLVRGAISAAEVIVLRTGRLASLKKEVIRLVRGA